MFVNRYDWASEGKVEEKIEHQFKSLNPNFKFKPHPKYGQYDVNDALTGGRLNLVDASYWKDIEKHFAFGHHPDLGQCVTYVCGSEWEILWSAFIRDLY